MFWILIELLKHVSWRVGTYDNYARKHLCHKLHPVTDLITRADTKDGLAAIGTVIECDVVDENYDEVAQRKASADADHAPGICLKKVSIADSDFFLEAPQNDYKYYRETA